MLQHTTPEPWYFYHNRASLMRHIFGVHHLPFLIASKLYGPLCRQLPLIITLVVSFFSISHNPWIDTFPFFLLLLFPWFILGWLKLASHPCLFLPVAQTPQWFMWFCGHITHWMATLAHACVYQCRMLLWHHREMLVYNRQSSTRTSLTELYPMEHLVFVRLMDEPVLRDRVFKGIAKPAVPVSPRKKEKKWRNWKIVANVMLHP